MTTIKILTIKTGEIQTQHYQDRSDAVRCGKWYAGLIEMGAKKYRVIIEKQK